MPDHPEDDGHIHHKAEKLTHWFDAHLKNNNP
jgi:hypothetical protein